MQARFWTYWYGAGLAQANAGYILVVRRCSSMVPAVHTSMQTMHFVKANLRWPNDGQPPWPALYPHITNEGMSTGLG